METLYRNLWAEQGCTAIAAQVGGIAILLLAAVAGIMLLILHWAARRRGTPQPPLGWSLAGIALLVLGIVAYAILDGRTTNRILVAADGLVFEGCDGLSGFRETLAFAEIAGAQHRTRRGGGRSARLLDEVVLTQRGTGTAWVIPLSNDAATLDATLLRRVVPAPVIEAWRRAVAQRGGRMPAGSDRRAPAGWEAPPAPPRPRLRRARRPPPERRPGGLARRRPPRQTACALADAPPPP